MSISFEAKLKKILIKMTEYLNFINYLIKALDDAFKITSVYLTLLIFYKKE